MRITWEIDPNVSGYADADNAQEASEVLTHMILDAYADAALLTRTHVMLNIAAPLAERINRQGAATVAQGDEWTDEAGGVRVRLTP